MQEDASDHSKTYNLGETRADFENTIRHLSDKGVRAMQGKIDMSDPRGEQDTVKGSNFERWAQQEVFHGEGRRLTVYPEDNPHLDRQSDDGLGLLKRRQSDGYLTQDGFVYELKAGYTRGGINRDQAYEYSLMQDSGYVFERDVTGKKCDAMTQIKGVSYIFDSKAGAEANRSEVEQYGFGILFRDETGRLQQLT